MVEVLGLTMDVVVRVDVRVVGDKVVVNVVRIVVERVVVVD